jgi:hypothetical protein
MKRRFRLANAKQVHASDGKRAAIHQAQAAAIHRRQKTYNNEVAIAQCEVSIVQRDGMSIVHGELCASPGGMATQLSSIQASDRFCR